jgi:hypothetical protein
MTLVVECTREREKEESFGSSQIKSLSFSPFIAKSKEKMATQLEMMQNLRHLIMPMHLPQLGRKGGNLLKQD